ncbi:O-antigen ligase family protein [Alteribacillus sp. HJP-4]|uniref:O-antigen ligase family protein n=1 Tax=Alteribacillus sp. HJP-4 TaxID=2775394 RepID=UPI0035CD1A68
MLLDLSNNRNLHRMLETSFLLFILIQPLIDVLAYFNIPISSLLRVAAILAGFVYLMGLSKGRWKKFSVTYLAVLFIYLGLHFGNNLIFKDPMSIPAELNYIFKTAYFLVMLLVYITVIYNISFKENWLSKVQQYIFINMAFISLIMFIAQLTGTGKDSYDMLARQGHSGWFFSGNELSAILAMGFCAAFLYYLQRRTTAVKMILLPFIILMGWSMLTIGTKAAFGGLIFVLGLALFYTIFEAVKHKRFTNVVIVVSMIVITAVTVPVSAVGNNLDLAVGPIFENLGSGDEEEGGGEEEAPPESEGDVPEEDVPEEEQSYSPLQMLVLNGRDEFFGNLVYYYENAPLSQQLLGMGRGGNYETSSKFVEMDFFDWFFNFGVIGFVILMLPLATIGSIIVKHIIKARFGQVDFPLLFIGLGACIGLGAGFVAGHVLSSPAPAIYLAIFIGYLYTLAAKKNRGNNV